jgi:hypothetical protein
MIFFRNFLHCSCVITLQMVGSISGVLINHNICIYVNLIAFVTIEIHFKESVVFV